MGGASNQRTAVPAMTMGQPRAAGAGLAPSPMVQPATPNVYQQSANAYTGALAGAQGAMGYQPQQINTNFGYKPDVVNTTFGYTPSQVAQQTAVGGINTYMNPYTQQVIDTSMADLERQRQQSIVQTAGQATSAGAYGGSRQGVAESLTNEAFARQGGQLASQLRSQGFQTALGASQQDIANAMQAQMANQQAGGRATEFGQQTTLQAQMANQQARARAAEFGQQNALQAALANQQAGLQGSQQSLQAAGQLGNLSNIGFGFGQQIGATQAQEGQRMQAMNQALIDAAKGQFGGFTGAPQDALTTYLAALGGAKTDQKTYTETQKPGLLQYLTPFLGGL